MIIKMKEENKEFMEMHLAVMNRIKEERGKLCLEIRKRNNLSREWVDNHCNEICDKTIGKIELNYNASIDKVNILYDFYDKQGYISKEEKERTSLNRYFGGGRL